MEIAVFSDIQSILDTQEWRHEFVALDYDRERVINEMRESGLEDLAPYWCEVTKHLILTGAISHGAVLAKAMKLCEEEQGNCTWYNDLIQGRERPNGHPIPWPLADMV